MALSTMLTKVDLFGINYAVVDYHSATDQIIEWVETIKNDSASKQGFGVTALAVHGLIEGYRIAELKQQINSIVFYSWLTMP
jgi:N-acetylglucosaminyldiphosphoundecaprenol N-acetyl-beta-D-mannosaminyltransferase